MIPQLTWAEWDRLDQQLVQLLGNRRWYTPDEWLAWEERVYRWGVWCG